MGSRQANPLIPLNLVSDQALSSQAAFAASGTYTKTGAGPNIYVAGTENSSFHSPPGGISTSATITSVSWSAGSYSNGWTTQNRRLCYTPPGATTYTTCKDISSLASGTTSDFNGLAARGSFRIIYILTGGTYPTTAGFTNSVTVNYNY
ncbi:hypothetical protein GGQ88_004135 [Novosphingobium hassiacum]|uniref:Spore coat protein U domain-containing protein n=1 Tax=Novosphingobium hassiacum TaxID=173676 RepID=A0A7W6EXX1_9SPHN|nr:flagellar protein FlhE [Novosphingobium hassiacum]MBB3862832.1 hypothetical protein [Novosphingobium hassiacum]